MPSNPNQSNEYFDLKETKPDIGGGRVAGSRRLTSSFDLVEEMNYLFVKVTKAHNLPPTCNPLVEVKIGNYKGATKHTENHTNPEWNQVFAFNKDRVHATIIEVLVRNKDAASNEIIGCVNSNVADVPRRVIPDSVLAPQWYRLQDKNGVRVSGELMLSLWLGTQADEAFADAWLSDSATVDGEGIINTRAKVYVTPRLWYLRVRVHKAQDLVPRDKNRNPEAFVKAIVGYSAMRSKVSSSKSLDPVWIEDLMFVVDEPFDDPLILSVEDKYGANKEECLGKIVIPLQNVEKRELPVDISPEWYNLERPVVKGEEKKEVKFATKLNMSISLDGGYHVLDESTYYSSDFRSSSKLFWTPVIGVLELGILDAKGLAAMKNKGGCQTTDAYCVAKYGPKWVRTKTIVDSLDPKWNEQYTWEVYDPYTVITIGVFDNVHLQGGDKAAAAKDPRIGKVRVRLSTLVTDRIYTYSYPLLVLQPKGLKKMGEIQLAVRFTCSNYCTLLMTYWKPLLPKMHYTHPLSVYQLDSLRHQAAQLLSSRLGRAEPPLRKEVVDYILDVGSNMWSLRRARANFARIISFFSVLIDAWRGLEKIRSWKNPYITASFLILFEIAVFHPRFMFLMLLYFCSLFGLWRLRKRPRHPPHMDATLSYADTANPDELDEEFDTFPTSKTGEALKARYDRLRHVGGRLIAVVGDLAHQVERIQSLMNWRDPRASAYFVVFCFTTATLVYVFSFKWLLSLLLIYVMRPPRFRVDIPPAPVNFLRRLPARTDSLL
ncbi:C2 domain-containing protein/PRT_C domain-containing protein [Cephalotus follicularis]|uniref:C2 domain-containing protein/PRT_C domain-containing protein n=1 Tax=Cephalotus follicularis TaxID=3775 RepID=A0A1Q3CZM1_CEPFO|nr:C2 domain-containing protein/PRT_C domain-containing protein [Cephalotus follicularis]